MSTTRETKDQRFDIFWGEIAPCEHLVQIYASDDIFLDSLEGFVAGGIKADDGVIVIATAAHLGHLHHRLTERGLHVNLACANDQYIPWEAESALSKFMVDGWPDENLFAEFVKELITRAGKNGRRVRAFGEMVALLWAHGNNGATVRLEHIWHRFCTEYAFSLFCAYPRIGFTQDVAASIQEICAAHSKIVEV
jgi:MEDS: MEthanogen/methylotroph, DcmR Sensory domain